MSDLYTQITTTRPMVTCMGQVYALDVAAGVWDRVTYTSVANHARMLSSGAPAALKVVQDTVDKILLNCDIWPEVARMNWVRALQTNYGLVDFATKRVIDIEEARDLLITRWGKPLFLRWDPSDPDAPELHTGNPVWLHCADGRTMDAWDYTVERYSIEYLRCLAVSLFGRVRKEQLWGFSLISDYGKTALLEVISDAMPGCITMLDGQLELTGAGKQWSGVEIELGSKLLVVVDEADKVVTSKGRLNSLSAESFAANPKYGRRFRTNRVGNVLFLGGGTIATEIDVQGVQNRIRHTYRFPLHTTIVGEIAQIKGDPRVGQHIVSALAMVAWSQDHEAVYAGTTEEARQAFERAKSDLRRGLEGMVYYEPWRHDFTLSDIIGQLKIQEPDIGIQYRDTQFADSVSKELKLMGFSNEKTQGGLRRRAYLHLGMRVEGADLSGFGTNGQHPAS